MPMDWTDNAEMHLAAHYGESIDDAPEAERAETAEELAEAVVVAAFQEAWDTRLDEEHAEIDYTVRGEQILIRHLAAAIRDARRAA